MTGWRLGFAAFPPEPMVEAVTRMMINTVSCTAAFSQPAALAAVTGPWEPVQAMVEFQSKRRDLIVEGLNRIDGITCQQPGGAFYAFPNVSAPLGMPPAPRSRTTS